MKVKVTTNGGRFTFLCPGCNELHGITNGWKFNGDIDKPTFQPSVLIKSGHYCDTTRHDHPCWCDYNREQLEKGEEPSGFTCSVCHSFITNGSIEFLSDSTHALVGQTVELPDYPQE